MAYVEGGLLREKRTIWRLSIFTETFWAIVFYIRAFFMSMFSSDDSKAFRKTKPDRRVSGFGGGGGGGGWDGGAPPGSGGGGPKRSSGVSRIRGIDHSVPACSSCCG